MSKIIAVHKEDRTITQYKTEDGQVLNKEDAVNMADRGQLDGVSSFQTRDGGFAIRSDRGQPNYSLDDLPEF